MRVTVGILFALAAIFLPAMVFGQPPADETKAVPIVLYPASEPRPALKYQLLPPFLERTPGNAAVLWNRLPAQRDVFFAEFEKEYTPPGRIDTWMNIPLDDPREKKYRENELARVIQLLKSGNLYSDMERAARFESCDWQLPFREGNYILVLLPEVQQCRTYARLLAAKAHLEIAEGKYDAAVRTLQTGYAEGRHVAQGPTIVNALVGVTIAGLMSDQVQQFIQRPDAPNLYWALSTLPRPLVDFRLAFEAESQLLYLQFPELRDLDKNQLSPEQWRTLLITIVDLDRRLNSHGPHLNESLASTAMAIAVYPSARRWLIEHGRTAAEVEAMPVAQVVLLSWAQPYNEFSDDQAKWCLLPTPEAGGGLEQAEKPWIEAMSSNPIAAVLTPAMLTAKHAETRCQWKIAVLRIFEAMRLYAANHDGRWPDNLSDITEVPVPMNPFDDKPFIYERQGNRAVLNSLRGPKGEPWKYEITLMPQEK